MCSVCVDFLNCSLENYFIGFFGVLRKLVEVQIMVSINGCFIYLCYVGLVLFWCWQFVNQCCNSCQFCRSQEDICVSIQMVWEVMGRGGNYCCIVCYMCLVIYIQGIVRDLDMCIIFIEDVVVVFFG